MPKLDAVVLTDPSSTLTTTFIPAAGMIGTSLADGDAEFLGQRRGLDAYLTNAKTLGIPLLYPWANRLSANSYDVNGTVVAVHPGTGGVHVDEHGSPIHGTLAADPGWLVTDQTTNTLTAELDFAGRPDLMATFPFPHKLIQSVTLADRTLSIETTIEPATSTPVPLCFGYHPYLTIPGVPRQDWIIDTPAMRHLPVDDHGLPTGAHAPWPGGRSQLGTSSYDDGFDQVPDGAVFAVTGGDRRLEVRFEAGYPAAQIYAPPAETVVCFEPMAAPTDALRRGGYRVASGQPAVSRFSITVA
ncbi:aldose 1-epimerase [Mycobacterium sp. OTB74]|uniref:aldose 1-epimerase n=1 Tax=Mycobacterium sp. OTB74 TaxID=1853452 RepID=UPI00247532FC|nr:aldose 1-epimerase [Mycobacterium sp. OTB74]MDH6243201.1 aldose 1-epimerase [Mycobacterium sp. OTB74]